MQFLILIAIGLVLMTDHLDSPLVFAPGWSGAAAVITSFLALILILIRTARKKIVLDLETRQLPVDLVQKTYIRAQHTLRVLALAGQFVLIFGTQWPDRVRMITHGHLAGLDELIMLLPFVLWLMAGYYFLYPADRLIRQAMIGPLLEISQPVHPVWTRRQYLAFQLQFQLLLIGLPLLLIVVARDLIDIPRPQIIALSRVYLAKFHLRPFAELVPEGLLGLFSCGVFLFAPFLVKWTWRAHRFPDGELRTGLLRLASDAGLKYRDVLLWPTYGVIVNAAVVGFVGPLRYILLSDGLVESLTDGQIEAVFGHEIGHVKLHHLPFFLVFAFASMGLVGLAGWELQTRWRLSEQTTEMIVLAAVAAVWFLAFGFISRRFEAQADLFGVQLLSREFDRRGCAYAHCLRHAAASNPSANPEPLCLVGAEIFSSALDRTAGLNAVPRSAKSWRHGSIRQRCTFVVRAAEHRPTLEAFQAQIRRIKYVLVLAAGVATAWAVYAVVHFSTLR